MKVKQQTQRQEQPKIPSGKEAPKEPAREHDDPVAATMSPRYSFGDTSIFSRPELQPEIFINQEHDHYEQEADEVARRVMSSAEREKSSGTEVGSSNVKTNVSDRIGKLSSSYDKQNGVKKADPSIFRDVLSGAGQPLDGHTRGFMESRFGHDFSQVRIHADGKSADTAKALNARAYATGNDIVFGRDQYAPEKAEGKRLLAHELTHVVQQRVRHTRFPMGSRPSFAKPPAMIVARDSAPTPPLAPRTGLPPTAPPFNVFEVAKLTPEGAMAAFDEYLKLIPADQKRAVSWSNSTGKLEKILVLLGPVNSELPKYAAAVQEILRWIEQTETRKGTGMTDAEMSKKQAEVIKEKGPSGYPKGSPRWLGLPDNAKKAWTERGKKAIDNMVSYASGRAPEMKLTKATFELEFQAIDEIAYGALATTGSQPGKNVQVGFEFVVLVEVNPAYAFSTVVHELKGHPSYDNAGGANYAGKLYQDAAAQVPADKDIDRDGGENFNYWQSEIYSQLKEIPYYVDVAPADQGKRLNAAGRFRTPSQINYHPRAAIEHILTKIKDNWHSSLASGIVRGFYKRIAADPSIQKVALTEFETLVKKVFGSEADKVLK